VLEKWQISARKTPPLAPDSRPSISDPFSALNTGFDSESNFELDPLPEYDDIPLEDEGSAGNEFDAVNDDEDNYHIRRRKSPKSVLMRNKF